MTGELITEDWLRAAGFKRRQLDRQPDKHWLLWLGPAIDDGMTSFEDLGIELAPLYRRQGWFCWLRSDCAGRYHRFIHIRHIETTGELVNLIEALTGRAWDVNNNLYSAVHSPKRAARIREESKRMDYDIRRTSHKWAEVEKDDTRGRALPEHLEAHEKAKEPGAA